jgi:hypothetical protein
MKTRQIMVLTVLLGLLAARDGLAFYNPETGRWLSRDPIGEQSFRAQFSAERPLLERRGVRGESLKPGYEFVANRPLTTVDYLGLSEVCTLTIRASHFLSGDHGAFGHYTSTSWATIPPGNAVGYVSCGANTLNEGVARQNPCAFIPGMYRNQGDPNDVAGGMKELMDRYGIPYDDYLEDIAGALDVSLEAAKGLARARCGCRGDCGSCKKVRIVVACDRDATQADLPLSRGGERESGVPKCGRSTTLDCQSGNFSMLR